MKTYAKWIGKFLATCALSIACSIAALALVLLTIWLVAAIMGVNSHNP